MSMTNASNQYNSSMRAFSRGIKKTKKKLAVATATMNEAEQTMRTMSTRSRSSTGNSTYQNASNNYTRTRSLVRSIERNISSLQNQSRSMARRFNNTMTNMTRSR